MSRREPEVGRKVPERTGAVVPLGRPLCPRGRRALDPHMSSSSAHGGWGRATRCWTVPVGEWVSVQREG